MLVIDQDQLVARLGVGEADAARARPVGNPPHRAMLLERPVRHVKQWREGFGRKALDAEVRHDVCSCVLSHTWRGKARGDTRFLILKLLLSLMGGPPAADGRHPPIHCDRAIFSCEFLTSEYY
jgi:hypothetical protein